MSNLPYVGLRPFQREETGIFFGREQHTKDLLAQLAQQHFIVVLGYSGSGKTSLINAGLIPQLLKAGFIPPDTHWKIAQMQPGNQLFASLNAALKTEHALGENFQLDLEMVMSNPAVLHELLATDPSYGSDNKLLIICDQFEDILRYPNYETAEFIKLLLTSSKPYTLPSGELSNTVYVLLTLRSEFLEDFASFPSLAEEMNHGIYQLPVLDREQLKRVIEEPAIKSGGEVEPELVIQLLEDTDQPEVPLPLLQHALFSLWAKSKDKKLTIFDYFAFGGLNRIFSNHAEQLYQTLNSEQQSIAKALFKNLIATGDDQSTALFRIKLSEIAALTKVNWQTVAGVVEAFRKAGQGFLLPAPSAALTSDTSLEIAYYNFIRVWPRLNDWREEEIKAAEHYALLIDKAHNYQTNSAGLLRLPELDHLWQWYEETKPTSAWAKRYGGDFNTAIAFLQKSKKTAQVKKLTLLLIGTIALAGIGSFTYKALSKNNSAAPASNQQATILKPQSLSQSQFADPTSKPITTVLQAPAAQQIQQPQPDTNTKTLNTVSEPAKIKANKASQPIATQQSSNTKSFYALNKRFPNKIQLLQEYKKLSLKDPELWYKLGNELKRQSNRAADSQKSLTYENAAIEAYQKSVASQADNYKAWFSLGDIYRIRTAKSDTSLKQTNRGNAIAAYSKVVELYPNSEWAFYYLGSLYQQQNDFDKAIENFKKQLKNTPNHKFAWQYLASAYQKQNKFKEAIEAYQQELKINPHNARAKQQLKYLMK